MLLSLQLYQFGQLNARARHCLARVVCPDVLCCRGGVGKKPPADRNNRQMIRSREPAPLHRLAQLPGVSEPAPSSAAETCAVAVAQFLGNFFKAHVSSLGQLGRGLLEMLIKQCAERSAMCSEFAHK